MHSQFDVIIAGAGPVGLFLATELGLAGLAVLVLERDPADTNPIKAQPLGLRGLNTPSLEALYRRGLLGAALVDTGAALAHVKPNEGFRSAGHFARLPINADWFAPSRWPYRPAGPAFGMALTDLATLNRALTERALALGVSIRYCTEVQGLTQHDGGVRVQAGSEVFESQWLVGCDGGCSHVRKLAGIAFEGTEPSFTGYQLLCELADPEQLKPGFQTTPAGFYAKAGQGLVMVTEFDQGRFDRSRPITLDYAQALLRRVSGTDVTIKALHQAHSHTDRAKLASRYCQGRVLLAGDSAHIHSPMGGQGLNTGLGDAINLGWKLAACINGWANPGLLDSYEAERRPVASQVLAWSRAQAAVMAPSPQGRALGALFKDLIESQDGANYFIGRIWGLTQRYELGDSHPLVGASAPDFQLSGSRLGQRLHSGQGLLLDFTHDPALCALCRPWQGRLDYLAGTAEDTLGLKALLIRPDGVVAWLAEGEVDLTAAEAALVRWFGPA